MANTGNVFPTNAFNNGGGTDSWVTPENIVSDNGSDTTCNTASSSAFLKTDGYGFSIPSDATINGVTLRVEASEHSGGSETLFAALYDQTGSLGSSKSLSLSGTAKSIYTYGSTSDLWGATLDPAVVNHPEFGVIVWFSTAHDVRIDFVTLAVEYTPASAGGDSMPFIGGGYYPNG